MKSLYCMLFFIFSGYNMIAQSVGIGTTTPVAKLSVEGTEATANGLGAAISLRNTGTTNTWYWIAGAPGTNTPNGGMSIGNDFGYLFNIGALGNIGIGMMPNNSKLSINGNTGIQGLNLLEFGAGLAGKEPNAGKIGYNAFGTNALTFVGGGNTLNSRSVYFFAEGGTTMNGPLEFNGPLRVNGNPGIAGQVLTSNGTNKPEWRPTAFSNNVRFAASFSSNGGILSDNTYFTVYNTSAADVTIGTNTITINKSGLYHIEGFTNADAEFSSAPSEVLSLMYLTVKSGFYHFSIGDPMPKIEIGRFAYGKTTNFMVELYVEAPAIINPVSYISHNPTPTRKGISGRVTGYLISE